MTATTVVAHGGALDGWLERWRALGQDGRDEVREGVRHVTPLASAEHGRPALRLLAGAAAAEKVPSYLGAGVDEVWIVDAEVCRVTVVRGGREVEASVALGLSVAQLTALLGWV